MKAIVLLGFDEKQNVSPSDRCGNLGDLGLDGPLLPATAVQGWTGGGRSFAPSSSAGFVAADNDDGDTLLTRDVTIQAIVQVNLALSAQPMTLIARGIDGSASEYYAYGLEVQAGAITGDIDVRWFWADKAGALHTQAAGTFTTAGDHATILLTATRRWESTTRVVCRYYVADHLLGEVVSSDGDIGGGTTGHTSIGARRTAGTWGRFFGGVIEQLAVHDYEMCAQEIETTWRRLSIHQPEGVARFRAMSPPGVPWSTDPSTEIAKVIRIWGQLAGVSASLAESASNLLSDNADVSQIERWEDIIGLPAKPLTSLDTRRDRVIAFENRENGFSLPILRSVLAPLFDLDASNVEIIEAGNRIVEPFDTLRAERWTIETTGVSSWTAVGGKLRCFVDGGESIPPTTRFHARTTLPLGRRGARANGARTLAQIKIDSVVSWPTATNLIVGLYWFEFLTEDKLWVGITKIGADWVLAHRRLVGGVLSALTTIAVLGASPTVYVRAKRTSSPTSMLVQYSTTGFGTDITSTTITCPPNPSYAGVSASADTSLMTTTLDVLFDDFTVVAPGTTRVFSWYAYRNPALPGAPDLDGARLLVNRYRPGHSHAAVITSRSFICGSSLLGAPLGGF